MKTPIRLGIVGLGPRGQSWLRQLLRMPSCEVTALCDRYPGPLGKAQKECPSAQTYTDYKEMIRHAPIDAVAVVAAPLDQVEVALGALEHGKHVLTEVPVSYSLDDCWDLVIAVEKSGLLFQMAENARFAGYVKGWQELVRRGQLGQILLAQGEYVADKGDRRWFIDASTGERISVSEAQENPNAVLTERLPSHPIAYAVHDISSLLCVLDDRVDVVTCMATIDPSPTYPEIKRPDYEMALMKTLNGTLIRQIVGFSNPLPPKAHHHWLQLIGTRGVVESPRAGWDQHRMWLKDAHLHDYSQMTWDTRPVAPPGSADSSGHGGTDYYPLQTFFDALQHGSPLAIDVYTALEASAPGIVAGMSAERNGVPLRLPDFRPGGDRVAGQEPKTREPETAGPFE